MNLQLDIDLEPLRQRVLDAVDVWHERRAARLTPTLHAAKLHLCDDDGYLNVPHLALVHEANLKNMSVSDLVDQIRDCIRRANENCLRIEINRQTMRTRVKTCTTEQELEIILREHA